MIKNVIFDIGQVLTTYSEINYFRKFGFDDEMCLKLVNATMRSTWWCECDRGVFTDEEIVDFFVRDTPELEKEIRETMSNIEGLVLPKETAIPWIRSLKERGIGVYYLSNFSRKAEVECADSLNFISEMDGGILSYRDQMIKPNPDIYRLILDRYGLKGEECVFIDDTMRNLPMAEKMGIHTIWYRDQKQAEQELEEILKI